MLRIVKAIILTSGLVCSGLGIGTALGEEAGVIPEGENRPYYGRYAWEECQAVLGNVAGMYCYLPNSLSYFKMSWIPGTLDYQDGEVLDSNANIPQHINDLPCEQVDNELNENKLEQENNLDLTDTAEAPYNIDYRLAADLETERYNLAVKDVRCDAEAASVGPPKPPPGPPAPPLEELQRRRAEDIAKKAAEMAEKYYSACNQSMHHLAKALGYDLPLVLANQQVDWLKNNWNTIDTMEQADALAEQGVFVIAARKANGHGHVAAIVKGNGAQRLSTATGQLRWYPNIAGGALGKVPNSNGTLSEIPGKPWSRGGRTMRDAWNPTVVDSVEFFTPKP
ncbi:MAG: hypothetical protein N4J56_007341 [Chroococcidiopsis sp. SAG 2025]|uniref:hypothetical protein n=1 Tax=Chroococcidiopsis sp. SAG 2025 TaxID=171389 RepID=UPI002936E6E0|nr:hypothetical protein [Chroococcidiopsis sp. SAG 2025]MDV2997636.1 hypothetical protein [Chroococcidiopsis sp. SAG 2025]